MTAIHNGRKPSDQSVTQMAMLFAGIKNSIESLIDLDKVKGQAKYDAMFKIRKNIADFREYRNHNDLRFSREHESILASMDSLCATVEEALDKESKTYLI